VADRRRIVTIDETTGTVATLLDMETGATYQSERDSFVVTPGPRKTTMADSQRRYGGSIPTGETHENGTIAWNIVVDAATADACTAAVEALLSQLESLRVARNDMFFEWRPDGSTASTYYEVRGPATYKPVYSWSRFVGVQSLRAEISIPVAPLGRLAAFNIAIGSTTIPATVALASAITGNAPALAAISLTTSGGTSPPIWALIGWTKRPGTPLASSVAPWGIIEAETGTNLVTWAVTANALYRGGNALSVVTSGAGSASAMFPVDPSVMQPDDFTPGEVQIEVWARVLVQPTVVSPKITLSLQPFAGTTFGGEQFSAEYGASGKLITKPASGSNELRFIKLGTLSMPVDTATPLKWNVKVAASWAAGSASDYALDYLVMVPARQRAVSPSGKPNDSTYPDFIASTAATTKTIRPDLSGRVASGAGNPGRDSGLGGSLLELPPGNVDLMIKLSSLVADDPTSDTTTEQISHVGVTGNVRVTPRVWLAG
jgi:hypothetical protein